MRLGHRSGDHRAQCSDVRRAEFVDPLRALHTGLMSLDRGQHHCGPRLIRAQFHAERKPAQPIAQLDKPADPGQHATAS